MKKSVLLLLCLCSFNLYASQGRSMALLYGIFLGGVSVEVFRRTVCPNEDSGPEAAMRRIRRGTNPLNLYGTVDQRRALMTEVKEAARSGSAGDAMRVLDKLQEKSHIAESSYEEALKWMKDNLLRPYHPANKAILFSQLEATTRDKIALARLELYVQEALARKVDCRLEQLKDEPASQGD